MNEEGLTHLENMTTKQARVHLGDVRWYVTTANNWVVRVPFDKRDEAKDALAEIRKQAFEEHDEDVA